MNIYESLNKIMEEVGAIKKDKKTTTGSIYTYRGVDQVMNALQPAFVKHKVFVVPEVLDSVREERTTKSGGNMIYSVGRVKYTFFAEDGTHVEAVVLGEGMDSSDKSSNKVMANAFKYACFQVLCIPTEETAVDNESENLEPLPKGKTVKEESKPKAEPEVVDETPKEEDKTVVDETPYKRMLVAHLKEYGDDYADIVKNYMFKMLGKTSLKELSEEECKQVVESCEAKEGE